MLAWCWGLTQKPKRIVEAEYNDSQGIEITVWMSLMIPLLFEKGFHPSYYIISLISCGSSPLSPSICLVKNLNYSSETKNTLRIMLVRLVIVIVNTNGERIASESIFWKLILNLGLLAARNEVSDCKQLHYKGSAISAYHLGDIEIIHDYARYT